MRPFLAIAAVLLFALPAQAVEPSQPSPKANLTILADEDLLLPLAQIARAYAIDSKTPLTVVVKNANEAEKQIEQGLEAHIIITADYPLIGRLTEQGMTDVSSRKPIARTQLALVTASALNKEASIANRISFASMIYATPDLPIYLDAPTSIEGDRAAKLLSGYDFSNTIAARAETKPTHDEVIASLRDEPSLALVLAASTVIEPDLRVLSLLPHEVSPPVVFDSVVLGSEAMAPSKTFTDYLSGRKARAIFAHFGYQSPLVR